MTLSSNTPNKIKLPPIPPGQKYKGLVIKFILATAFCFVIFSLATLLFWFLGIITSSLIFDAKDFSLEFTKNVIHGGVLFAVLILFFAIGNCLVIAFKHWKNKK